MRKVVWGGPHLRRGHWVEYRTYFFEDGVLRFDLGEPDESQNGNTLRWIRKLGYDSVLGASKIDAMIFNRCVGKTERDLEALVLEYAVKLKMRREKEARSWDEWQELRQRFDGYVIGIDKSVDVYEDGFSVRVLLSAQRSFEERKAFVSENYRDLMRYVIGEITRNKRIMGKIGDIRFYNPVEVIVLRVPELDVKFDVKVA